MIHLKYPATRLFWCLTVSAAVKTSHTTQQEEEEDHLETRVYDLCVKMVLGERGGGVGWGGGSGRPFPV